MDGIWSGRASNWAEECVAHGKGGSGQHVDVEACLFRFRQTHQQHRRYRVISCKSHFIVYWLKSNNTIMLECGRNDSVENQLANGISFSWTKKRRSYFFSYIKMRKLGKKVIFTEMVMVFQYWLKCRFAYWQNHTFAFLSSLFLFACSIHSWVLKKDEP